MNKQITLHFNCEEDKVKFRIFLMMKHFDYWDKYTDNDMTEEEKDKRIQEIYIEERNKEMEVQSEIHQKEMK